MATRKQQQQQQQQMDALFDRPTAGGTPGFGFSDQLAAASGVATGRSQDLEVLDSATDFRTGPVGVPPKHGHIKDPTLYINITHIPTKHSISLEGWVSQFSDQFQSTWSGTPVYGRMDDLYTFQRTGRKISIQFDVVASDRTEAAHNQHKLNRLAQFLYPVYTPEKTSEGVHRGKNQRVMVSPPLLKMGWVNLMENNAGEGGLVGFLNGFSYTPTIESGQFFNGPGPSILNYQHYSVQLEFTVLHTHLTGWSQDSTGKYVFGGSEEQEDALRSFPHAASPTIAAGDWNTSLDQLVSVTAAEEDPDAETGTGGIGNQEAEAQEEIVLKGPTMGGFKLNTPSFSFTK